MNNNKTPASTVIFYIIGIILLIVSAFMLVTAITYTKTYLQSYDASFSDMWSNSIQYIITQFVPYFGMGIICLGLGRAIKGSAAAKAAAPIAETKAAEAQPKEAVAPQAAQRTALQKHRRADAGPVVYAEALNVEDQPLHPLYLVRGPKKHLFLHFGG